VSLRWKVALALAAITLVATAAVGVASYRSTRSQLYGEIDRSLVEVVARIGRGRDRLPERGPLALYEAQSVSRGGVVIESTFGVPVRPSGTALSVVGVAGATVFETVDVGGEPYRMRTIGLDRGAVQVARPLAETERVLDSLRVRTVALTLLVAGVAAAIGLWLAGRVTASLRRLTVAAEHVGATGRLDTTVGVAGSDEVGRLAAAFDRMLVALARSQEQQRRLVQDAGHELRTPLTSLRTNIDTLRRYHRMSDADRDAILADLHEETQELSELVDEIVAVASGDLNDEPAQSFDLTELATELAVRAERRRGRPVVVIGEAAPVVARRGAVQRAVSCLIENADKFDGSGGPIEVHVDGATLWVADRGPGIPDHELALVFERFHRAEAARSSPGSGLGLSIVREVARRHDGDVFARHRDGGGAEVGFTLR
jgi:two-component system, OmpR family, sensor histidine kinase MprB